MRKVRFILTPDLCLLIPASYIPWFMRCIADANQMPLVPDEITDAEKSPYKGPS